MTRMKSYIIQNFITKNKKETPRRYRTNITIVFVEIWKNLQKTM